MTGHFRLTFFASRTVVSDRHLFLACHLENAQMLANVVRSAKMGRLIYVVPNDDAWTDLL
jgi:hypothetical protein